MDNQEPGFNDNDNEDNLMHNLILNRLETENTDFNVSYYCFHIFVKIILRVWKKVK